MNVLGVVPWKVLEVLGHFSGGSYYITGKAPSVEIFSI